MIACLSMCFSVISVGKKSRFIIEVEMNCQETTVTFAHEAWHYLPKKNSSTTLLWVPFWKQMWLGVADDMAMQVAPETRFCYNNQRLFRCSNSAVSVGDLNPFGRARLPRDTLKPQYFLSSSPGESEKLTGAWTIPKSPLAGSTREMNV